MRYQISYHQHKVTDGDVSVEHDVFDSYEHLEEAVQCLLTAAWEASPAETRLTTYTITDASRGVIAAVITLEPYSATKGGACVLYPDSGEVRHFDAEYDMTWSDEADSFGSHWRYSRTIINETTAEGIVISTNAPEDYAVYGATEMDATLRSIDSLFQA